MAAPCLVWECARVLGAVAFELVVAVLRIEMLCLDTQDGLNYVVKYGDIMGKFMVV